MADSRPNALEKLTDAVTQVKEQMAEMAHQIAAMNNRQATQIACYAAEAVEARARAERNRREYLSFFTGAATATGVGILAAVATRRVLVAAVAARRV